MNSPPSPSIPIEPTHPGPELFGCLAAIPRALAEDFRPGAFLDDLSAELQPLVPHEWLEIQYLADGGRTFSVFAEHVAPGLPSWAERYTTDSEREARFPVAESPLASAFRGSALRVADLTADARFAGASAHLAKLRSALVVPLRAGSRIIGALAAGSTSIGVYQETHAAQLAALAGFIGPLIEIIAIRYSEVRRHHRLSRLGGIARALGTTLDVRAILKPLAEEIRPALDFDVMGLRLLTAGPREYVLFGFVGDGGEGRVIDRVASKDASFAARLEAGRPVLVRVAHAELDRGYAGDRAVLAGGLQSVLLVPMSFGDEISGSLFFGKREPYWYAEEDAEIGMVVARQMALAIQHQRLGEEQRRLASVEHRAHRLAQSLESARSELRQRYGFQQILGASPLLRETLTRAAQVAPTESTVLVTGESGTGKELVARAIHHASARADGPFVAVNCAALADTLLESELFGHERGAFTGADRQKPGRFDLAAGGTLFLDEIGDLSAALQVKLLRVIQEREYQRVGGTATLKADVRLIAATHRDLSAEMAAGRFRSDLFYRLSVFNVHLPPLRERGEDVLLLADRFIRTLAPQMGRGDLTLSRDARETLLRHRWPGNIRELQNAIERGIITSEGSLVTSAHLGIPTPSASAGSPPAAEPSSPPGSLETLERTAILEALRHTQGHKSRAAARLGLSRFQLYARLKRHQIEFTPD